MSHDFPLVLTRKWESQRKSENSSNGELVPYCTGWLLLVRAHNPAPITSNSHTKSVTKQDSAAKALHTFSSNWSHPSFTVSHSLAEGFFSVNWSIFPLWWTFWRVTFTRRGHFINVQKRFIASFYDFTIDPLNQIWNVGELSLTKRGEIGNMAALSACQACWCHNVARLSSRC